LRARRRASHVHRLQSAWESARATESPRLCAATGIRAAAAGCALAKLSAAGLSATELPTARWMASRAKRIRALPQMHAPRPRTGEIHLVGRCAWAASLKTRQVQRVRADLQRQVRAIQYYEHSDLFGHPRRDFLWHRTLLYSAIVAGYRVRMIQEAAASSGGIIRRLGES
jgi:hypothetical protein